MDRKLLLMAVAALLFFGCSGGGNRETGGNKEGSGRRDISVPLFQLVGRQTDFPFTEIQGEGGDISVSAWQNSDNTFTLTMKASKPVNAMESTVWLSEGEAEFEVISPSDTWMEEAENSGAAETVALAQNIKTSFSSYSKMAGVVFTSGNKYQIGRFTLIGVNANTRIALTFGKK